MCKDGKAANGTNIQSFLRNDSDAQKWYFVPYTESQDVVPYSETDNTQGDGQNVASESNQQSLSETADIVNTGTEANDNQNSSEKGNASENDIITTVNEIVADKVITDSSNDEGSSGSRYAPLALRSLKQSKTKINLTWNKVKGAKKYVIYGNACGRKNKMKKLATVGSNTKAYNVRKISKKLKKGTYHKFLIIAVDKNNKVISTSKVIHVATKGGKVTNPIKVTVKAKLNKNGKALKKYTAATAIKIKRGKKTALKTHVGNPKRLKVKKHRAACYESSNTKIATVSKKGVVTAKKKGICYIYAYAQNGIYKRVQVVVK